MSMSTCWAEIRTLGEGALPIWKMCPSEMLKPMSIRTPIKNGSEFNHLHRRRMHINFAWLNFMFFIHIYTLLKYMYIIFLCSDIRYEYEEKYKILFLVCSAKSMHTYILFPLRYKSLALYADLGNYNGKTYLQLEGGGLRLAGSGLVSLASRPCKGLMGLMGRFATAKEMTDWLMANGWSNEWMVWFLCSTSTNQYLKLEKRLKTKKREENLKEKINWLNKVAEGKSNSEGFSFSCCSFEVGSKGPLNMHRTYISIFLSSTPIVPHSRLHKMYYIGLMLC